MDDLRDIFEIIREKLYDPELDFAWTDYDSADMLRKDFEWLCEHALKKQLSAIKELKLWFLPTSTLQELSLSNGWGDEFLGLAKRFDQAILGLD